MWVRVVLGALVAAIACVPGPAPAADLQQAAKVGVGNNFYDPARIEIGKGSRLRFRWAGGVPHNVTLRRGPGRQFESETTTEAGVNFRHTFDRRGRYSLICTIHPDEMRMTVRVR